MLTTMKQKLRHIFRKRPRTHVDAREEVRAVLEHAHIGEPEAPVIAITPGDRRHDGWGEIRPRRPGEDTNIGLRLPDITSPGKELRPVPVEDDDDDEE